MPLVKITLSGPAKVGGEWRKFGETLTVDADLAGQLENAGALAAPPVIPQQGAADLARAVEAEAQRDVALARILELQDKLVDLSDACGAARDRAAEAEAEVRSLQARNHELEAELAEVKAARTPDEIEQQDTPPEQAAKTARKKGAAADMG